MNSTLQSLLNELDQLAVQLDVSIPSSEPFSIAHNNWTFPGLTKNELISSTKDIAASIRERGPDELGSNEALLADYVRRLTHLRSNVVPNIWGNANHGVPTFLFTLDGLSRALVPSLKSIKDTASELNQTAQRLTKKLSALEARLNDTEPRSAQLAAMVARIEQAYDAADQLPADLESLAEGRKMIAALLEGAQLDYSRINQDQDNAARLVDQLSDKHREATSVLEHCHSAYAAATSQGLAAAFTERSQGLATTMWVWTAAFVAALGIGAYFGTERVHEIEKLLTNPAMTNWALGINLLLAALSVGAPIWFGWMAAKQINQRFRLSEDYAFKAAVSRAYEGYRKEAARIDKDMEARLLSSALTRLDEQPLRFVETANHGTPWQELASSDAVKSAMSSIPGFADKVIDLARTAVQSRAKPAANDASTVSAAPTETPKV